MKLPKGIGTVERQLLTQKFGPQIKLLDRALTRAELDLLYAIKDQYWIDFSNLIEMTLAKAPAELHPYLESMLQECSSVYGRNTR